MFQSLFWWMLVLNYIRNILLPIFQFVSILVLMDVGLKRNRRDKASPAIQEFQSLFWWMLVLNTPHSPKQYTWYKVSILVLMDVGLKHWIDISQVGDNESFNPCFDGCWS